MDVNWNKFDFKPTDVVILDTNFRNRSEVEIVSFTPNKMFAKVKSKDGDEWQTMTTRLTPKQTK